MSALLAFLALLAELAVGYPDWLYRKIGHPVSWIGRLVALADTHLNRERWSDATRRAAGVVALALVLGVTGVLAWLVQTLLGDGAWLIVAAILAGTLLAQRSLAAHVEAVAVALETGGLEAGREAVSRIVGRDPASLDEAGVSRAAIESLAENFSDGVVAPVFWIAIAGLPGGALYKAVNTADSMVGHRTERHQAFGWAAARLDDLVNLPASRLTALLIVCVAPFAAGEVRRAWQAVRRDASHHRSPNAGWPEAAMAGALGLALAGPRRYEGNLVDDAIMGAGGRREANAGDIRRALRLYRWADAMLIVLIGVMAGLVTLHG
ncbi:MAG: adenosylcobinamide-phosphate synthase CbiB [Pseudomonadota bacterium]